MAGLAFFILIFAMTLALWLRVSAMTVSLVGLYVSFEIEYIRSPRLYTMALTVGLTRLTVSAGTASTFVLGRSKNNRQETTLGDLLDSIQSPKVARSVAILCNYKNETNVHEVFFNQSVFKINKHKWKWKVLNMLFVANNDHS